MNIMRQVFVSISRVPPLIILAIPVACSIAVAFMVTSSMKTPAPIAAAQKQEFTTVLVCKKDIHENQVVSNDLLEEQKASVDKVPFDAIASMPSAVGRRVKYGMSAGSVISQHDLAPIEADQGFEAKLAAGMRAVTFPVDGNSGVAGFISPDSHVDILAMAGTGAETKAYPILSDVKVIAVGQTYQKGHGDAAATPASSVTVAVNSSDSQKLVKAINASKLYLVLRKGNDHSPVATADVTQLFDKPEAPPAQMAVLPELPRPPIVPSFAEDRGRYIELWSAGKKELQKVSQP